jgi:electron transport complex protein RnfC
MIESVVTVAGPVVGEPANLLVRAGTPLRDVLEYCKTDLSGLKKVALGGSMRGRTQPCLDVPLTREITCVYATNELHPARQAHPCIRCGYCVQACPMRLVPSLLAELVRDNRFGDAARRDVLQCIECGACSWICPSKINLVHYMQLGKYHAEKARKADAACQPRRNMHRKPRPERRPCCICHPARFCGTAKGSAPSCSGC